MLTQKLLRLDEATIQEVEELAQELSKTEYTSFSALVRKLINIGLDHMKKTEKILKKKEEEINRLETALEIAIEALKKIAVKEELEEVEEETEWLATNDSRVFVARMTDKNGSHSPARDNTEVLYVVQEREGKFGVRRYLTIEGFNSARSAQSYNTVESARISWVDDLEGASEWIFDSVGNKQVVLKRFTDEGWVLDGGWCVGLDTAEYFVKKFDGVITPIFRHKAY